PPPTSPPFPYTTLFRSKGPQDLVVVVAGVGYRVHIPVSTFYRLGEPGEAVSLRIHTHVREDALVLFGFLGAHEQDLFEQLISVSDRQSTRLNSSHSHIS